MTGASQFIFESLPDLAGASCKDVEDKEFFFPSDHQLSDRISELRDFCGSCPVQAKCLNFALDQRIGTGFWGGKTAKERRKMSRNSPAKPGRTSRVEERGPLIFQMRANGASYEEIALHLGISESAAIQTVVRYRKQVRGKK